MSEIVSESDIELGNVFQQIFMECDMSSLSTSMTYSTLSLGDEIPISKIVHYVQEQLPIWSLKHMLELWKCLSNVSTNDHVNLLQFKEATKCWIAKMLQIQMQDDNNNIEKEPYKNTNDTTMDLMKTNIDKDIAEVELRMRLRKFDEENIILREELARAEELITNFERQCNSLENRLDRYTKKCQQLERENDEQKDKLNEMIKNEKNYVSAYQKSTKKYESLSKQLETAEIENQAIQPLKEKMEKINKENRDYTKQVIRFQEELYEKGEECEKFRVMMAELQNTNSNIKETYEHTISNLREKNRQLTDANMELQSLSICQGERFLLSPIPSTDGCHLHSTPYKLEKIPLENSLYAELRASGFTAECNSTASCKLELEEELDYYDTVISTTLEQLDKIIQSFPATSDAIDTFQLDLPHTEDERIYNIETLKHKVALLLDMVTKKTASKNTRDSSTQLRVDCSDALENSVQFGITSFRAGLTCVHQCLKPETDLRLTASQDVSDNKDDLFLKVIRNNTNVLDHNIIEVIDPLFAELDRIIEQTINSPIVYKDLPASGNSRYRSIYTLPSSPQASLANAEDTEQAPSCQSLGKNSLDTVLPIGDDLIQRDCGGKSAELETESARHILGEENSPHPEEARPNKMPKLLSALRVDSKALVTSAETSTENFQAPEITVTSPLTSPRRKFSVYFRSFDVVEDDQGSCLEVRRSLSNSSIRGNKKTESGDEAAGNEMAADDRVCDQNGVPRYLFSHSYRNVKHDSDSSNSCSPQKQFSDGPPDDEPSPVVQAVPRKVYLAPTRLQFSQEIESRSNKTDHSFSMEKSMKNCVSATDSSESHVPPSYFPTFVDGAKSKRNAFAHSPSKCAIEKCEYMVNAALESNSHSVNEKFSQGHLTSTHMTPYNRIDSTKVADPEDPHSWMSVQRVDGDQPSVERSVDSQMSSREDTSAGEDSKCESTKPSDCCIDEGVRMGANEPVQTADAVVPLIGSPIKKIQCENTVQNDEDACDRNLFDTKQERRKRRLMTRRSFSEGDSNSQTLCRCRQHDGLQTAPLIQMDNQFRSFPNLTSNRLQEFGIANLPDTEMNSRENLSEFELQKRYTAFSLCLCTDRVTLPRRMGLSFRQRDQSEKNLACEVQKMQQDIQDTLRQRNSISGRMTLRRPSLNYESSKWENERLGHTDSSSSISELRGIFEHAESRRGSKEENNNMLRLNQFNSQNIINCAIVDDEIWTNPKQETCPELLPVDEDEDVDEDINRDCKQRTSSSQPLQLRDMVVSWRVMLWGVLIFFLGFYVNRVVSDSSNQWIIEQIFKKYFRTRNVMPHPT